MDYSPLRNTEVGVVESRAVEEASVCSAECSQSGVGSERIGQEVVAAGCSWVDNLYRTDLIRHICASAAGQGNVVIGLVHLDGESRGEAGNALNLPALSQAFWRPLEGAIEWYLPDVAGHEIVPDVAGRQPTAQSRVQEIHQVIESRGIVQSFRESVRRKERKIIGLTLHGDLSGVV